MHSDDPPWGLACIWSGQLRSGTFYFALTRISLTYCWITRTCRMVGSLDVDLDLDAEALGDGEYATLIDALRGHGYQGQVGPTFLSGEEEARRRDRAKLFLGSLEILR